MSHVAKINLVITNLDAVERACQRLGLELVRGQKTYRWYNRWVNDFHGENAAYRHGIDPKDYGKCDHAIRIPGDNTAYEIGLVKNPNGEGWLPIFDFYGPGRKIAGIVGGNDAPKLKQYYGAEVAREVAIEHGYSIEDEYELEDGSIQLVINT